MWEYGEVAVLATELFQNRKYSSPRAAWDAAADQLLATPSLREKNCPRTTFLSLCQDGLVVGIPMGNYTRAKENKEYAIEAVRQLVRKPVLADLSPDDLWQIVIGGREVVPNSQMHVVLTLWKRSLIAQDRVSQVYS